MSRLLDPANARIVTYFLFVTYCLVMAYMCTTIKRQPAIATAASIVGAGLSVLMCTFVDAIPGVSYLSLVLVVAGMLGTILLAIACVVYTMLGIYASRPASDHQEQRPVVDSDEDWRFARLARPSSASVEIGHRI